MSGPGIHARTHVCGGTDPIPGICDLFGRGGPPDYETGVLAISNLRGYWRLGEGGFPYADTSGYDPGNPADMGLVTATGSVALTQDFTPGGLGVDDDGAVQFNFDGDATMGPPVGELMQDSRSGADHRFDFSGNDPFTVACWIRPLASAHTYRGTIIGTLALHAGADNGWRLHIDEPSRVVGFCRAPNVTSGVYPTVETPAGLAANTWHHIVGSYDGSTLRLYVNGTLVDSLADSSTMAVQTNNVYIGEGPAPMGAFGQFFYGAVDEAAVWAAALTPAEIAGLYQAGVSGDSSPAGQVLTSDGTGGVHYAYPTTKVDGSRYDEILAGSGLTSTDNADGTVTLEATGSGGASVDDTAVWMPLTTTVAGDDVLVFDADHSLIPTLIPF